MCPSSKFNVTPLDACDDPNFYMEKKNGKASLKRGHVYYDQVKGLLGLTGAQWCDFVYTWKESNLTKTNGIPCVTNFVPIT